MAVIIVDGCLLFHNSRDSAQTSMANGFVYLVPNALISASIWTKGARWGPYREQLWQKFWFYVCICLRLTSFNDVAAMTASAVQRDKNEVTFVLILSDFKWISNYCSTFSKMLIWNNVFETIKIGK